jgi:hypothetical protein
MLGGWNERCFYTDERLNREVEWLPCKSTLPPLNASGQLWCGRPLSELRPLLLTMRMSEGAAGIID